MALFRSVYAQSSLPRAIGQRGLVFEDEEDGRFANVELALLACVLLLRLRLLFPKPPASVKAEVERSGSARRKRMTERLKVREQG